MILRALKSKGWECTFDWTAQHDGGPAQYPDIALAEIATVPDADVVLVLLPGG